MHYHYLTLKIMLVSVNICPMDQFRCNDGKCIPIAWACDGFSDCDLEEDEEGETCTKGKYTKNTKGIFRNRSETSKNTCL